MRIFAMTVLVSVLVLGLFHWHDIEGRIRGEVFSLDRVPMKVNRMAEDLAELAADHPTFERLCARFYVGRALDSCDYAFMALPEEIDDFSKAIQLDPKYARAYVYRGQAMHVRNEKEREADLLRAIELDPKGKVTQVAYSLLGTQYLMSNHEYEKAIKVFDTAIFNSSSSEESLRGFHCCRAWAYEKSGRYQMSIDDYSKAISIDPQNYGQYKSRGLAYGHLGNHQQELIDCDKAIKLETEYRAQTDKMPMCQLGFSGLFMLTLLPLCLWIALVVRRIIRLT